MTYHQKYREKNRLKMREYNRKYNKQWRKKNGYASEYKYFKANPEKVRAYTKLRYAVKIGRILKQSCEVCGSKAQAHHDDYSKPLDVRWLCPVHHSALHRVHNF